MLWWLTAKIERNQRSVQNGRGLLYSDGMSCLFRDSFAFFLAREQIDIVRIVAFCVVSLSEQTTNKHPLPSGPDASTATATAKGESILQCVPVVFVCLLFVSQSASNCTAASAAGLIIAGPARPDRIEKPVTISSVVKGAN